MKIGVIACSEVCEPVLYYLVSQKATISLFYAGLPAVETTKQMVAFCETYHIPLVIETTKDHLYEWAQTNKPDVIFIAGYGSIINITRLGPLKHGIFNIHFGALPGYRGPSPVFWQLKNGEKNITICIHRITGKTDAGPIVWQKSIVNEEFHTYTYIHQLLSNITVEGVAFILNCFVTGSNLQEFSQAETNARYYSRPVLKDVIIDWPVMHTAAIFNLCKACSSWNQGAITSYKGFELKILDITISADQHNKEPGAIITIENNLQVACIDGSCSINFMSLNGLFFPGRHAKHFGMAAGQRLGI